MTAKMHPYLGSLAALALVGLLLVVGAGCHTTITTSVAPAKWNDEALLTLEADSATTGPFLAFNSPDASTTSMYGIGTPTSGIDAAARAIQGQAPAAADAVTFAMKDVTPGPMYLNLSVPVFGIIYVSSSAAQTVKTARDTGLDALQYKIEVLVGGQRVGGELITHNAAAVVTGPAQAGGTSWVPLNVWFRPEMSLIDAGSTISIKVTRISSLGDIRIATGAGAPQSFVKLRYFTTDPLGSNLYIDENRRVVTSTETLSSEEFLSRVDAFIQDGGLKGVPPGTLVRLPSEAEKDDSGGLVAAGAIAGLGGIGLLGLRRPKKGPTLALLVSIVFAVSAFGGCLASDPNVSTETDEEDEDPKPTVEASYEPREELKEAGHGAINGTVHDEFEFPIKGAHVALLGTIHSARTDASGLFSFPEVPGGVYTIRIDADKFAPIEQEVAVQVGDVTLLDIRMVPPFVKTDNSKKHLHDYWSGAETKPLWEQTVTPVRFYTIEWKVGSNSYCDGFFTLSGQAPASASKQEVGCEARIPIEENEFIVPPGTKELEVKLTWTAGGNMPKEAGLRVETSTTTATDIVFVPRPSGDVFRVPIYPTESDSGHQLFTAWKFFVIMPYTDTYHPVGPAYFTGGAIVFRATAIKGVVPYEPPHKDLWAERDQIEIFNARPFGGAGTYRVASVGTKLPSSATVATTSTGWAVRPAAGILIPPGTSEIRGTLTYTNANFPAGTESLQTKWGVAFLAAEAAERQQNWHEATMTANGTNNYNFVIKMEPKWSDQFYMRQSSWYFSIFDQAHNENYDTQYQTKLTIWATAHKDPNWEDA